MFEAIQSLFLYGALGLVALGLFINSETGTQTSFFPILWIAGSLFVYNLDRLVPDPADQINNPTRANFAKVRKGIICVSLAVCASVPVVFSSWSVAIPLFAAIAFSSLYSVTSPIVERRIKDVLLLKWIVPPTIVLVALTAPSWMEDHGLQKLLAQWPMLTVLFAGLLINILLFDQRDRAGDLAAGTKTIATWLTLGKFRILLIILLLSQVAVVFFYPSIEITAFTVYTGGLVAFAVDKKANWFYDWAVDGMLFVPWICKYLSGKLT